MKRSQLRDRRSMQAAIVALLAAACAAVGAARRPAPEMQFRSPPRDARPLTWWHWLNGNITREGITKDLDAMARIGLGGCYMFNCGGLWPTGEVRFLQAEWLEMVRHTLAEAERLGLSFGVHNCDGFSQAGGPWITPETSMKILVWTAAELVGTGAQEIVLAQPETHEGFYRDIAVIAFPVPAGSDHQGELTGTLSADELGLLADGDPTTMATFPPSSRGHHVEWRFPAARVIRSLRAWNCTPHVWESDTPMILEVSADGTTFRPAGVLTFNWDFAHSPRKCITAAFNGETARVARLSFTNSWAIRISEVALSEAARVHFAEAKSGRLRSRGHGAESRHYRAYPGPDPARAIPESHRICPADVVDLTNCMTPDGRLSWTCPDSRRWRVLRIGYTSNGHYVAPATPEGRGLECDKLDGTTVRFHLDQYMGRLLKLAGPAVSRTFVAMEIDSWECGIQNWTDGLERRFLEACGYALTVFWPALLEGWIVGSADQTERMLWDWRRFLADELDRNYFAVAAQFTAEHGLTYVAESTGRQQYLYNVGWHRHSHVPMGEFWLDRTPGNWLRVDCKVASSLAHISGRNVVAAESYTASPNAARWQNHPFSLKELGDQAFCAGINQFVFHTYAHQPWDVVGPGFTFFHWGLNFNRHNTWWDEAAAWIEYLARCQWMLRQGRFVADVLACVGEDVPNRIGWRDELIPPLPGGFDFDGADAQAIFEARVEDGWIVLPSGMRYRLLLLPPVPTMRPALAEQVRRLLEAGAIVLAPVRISRSPSLRDLGEGDRRVEAVLGHLWADVSAGLDRQVGRGRLFSGLSFEDVFHRLGVPPDVEIRKAQPQTDLRWIHRRIDDWDADVYFVANTRRAHESVELVFRDAIGEPELWDPVSGNIRGAGLYRREKDGRCLLPLELPPFGSLFVVFRPAGRTRHAISLEMAAGVPTMVPSGPAPGALEAENNFTLAAWVKTGVEIPLPPERRDAIAFRDQHWLVPAPHGERMWGVGHAGLGVAVGRNGVVLFEHSARHAPAVLTWTGDLSRGAHVVVVCSNGVPALYIDGRQVRQATGTTMRVHARLGRSSAFRGYVEGLTLWPRCLEPAEIAALATQHSSQSSSLPAADIERGADGSLRVRRWRPDPLLLQLDDGRQLRLESATGVSRSPIRGPWTVSFPAGRGAPNSVIFDQLTDWSEHPHPGIRYFSGTAAYSTLLNIPPEAVGPNRELWLDLGRVEVIATVRLNGREIGTLWAPPFRLRLDPAPPPGSHSLEVRVTNLWINRMIGDASLPDDDVQWAPSWGGERVSIAWPEWLRRGEPRPSGRIAFATRGGVFSASDPLSPSGLLGPVELWTVVLERVQ